ncbi:receptor activity-modifying protein 2 isoform X2 [Myripristis murdjan]|uniref:receptor activity-modifying protein 2 isoform X2 n=1 Tax=Myripristis murdjan TaxID=586833 RepID=UPI001175D75A|nr:receptor activity-modifying protein 2 isoform X2 [Myripristis murdjan]
MYPLPVAGCTTVFALVNQELEEEVLQATTPEYYITEPNGTANSSCGDSITVFGCGNKCQICQNYRKVCEEPFPIPPVDCLSLLFEVECWKPFKLAMDSLNSTDWCIWHNVRGAYNNFSLCTEQICDCLLIPWPNSLVEHIFVKIHSMFFEDCPTEELSDPPPGIVFALVITPICLIPVMVILVVLKTKNGDGSS